VENITFILETSPNAKPKEKKVGGTRPPRPPPNCADGGNKCYVLANFSVKNVSVTLWFCFQCSCKRCL